MIEYYKNLSLENLFYTDENGVVQEEEWRGVPNYVDRYSGSNLGRVKSLNWNLCGYPKILKQGVTKKGYLSVSFCKNNNSKSIKVHRLVCELFTPNPENKPQVNHKGENPNKKDNRVWMLEWATQSENMRHAVDCGAKKTKEGNEHHNSKLSVEDVLNIRKSKGVISQRNLAKKYNVCQGTIYKIINNISYNNI